MIPQTREEFMYHCLRKNGYGVTDVNVSIDQVDDRIDEALKFFHDYHFDGAELVYYKHVLEDRDYPDRINTLHLYAGGTGYANGDTISFTGPKGEGGSATITTDNAGAIVDANLTDLGHWDSAPTTVINTSTGTGANIGVELGGFIKLPDHFIGAVRIFDLSGALMSTTNMFSPQYQFLQNELFTITSSSMVPFYTSMTQLELIRQLLVGSQPIRYNRLKQQLYIDMYWGRVKPGQALIIEAWEAIDPDKYPNIWGDRFLQKYCAALIKQDYGTNLKKHGNMPLPGGVVINGQTIYDEATADIKEIEARIKDTYSLPNPFIMA